MSFLMYQRSDPRNQDWLPIVTQQIRLRNIIQIIGINIESNKPSRNSSKRSSPIKQQSDDNSFTERQQQQQNYDNNRERNSSTPTGENQLEEIYFTLHSRPMSVPFYTSDKLRVDKRANQTKNKVLFWKEIEPRDISESVPLSTTGCIVCVWSSSPGLQNTAIVSWGIVFHGLHYIGWRPEWKAKDFRLNTLIFHTPFGYFTSVDSFVKKPTNTQRFVYLHIPSIFCKPSYTVKNLANLHSFQRSVLDEVRAAGQLKSTIALYGYSPNCGNPTSAASNSEHFVQFHSSLMLNEKSVARIQQGKTSLKLKEEIQNLKLKVNVLREEKAKALSRVNKLKVEKSSQELNNNSLDLLNRMQTLGRDKTRLFQLKMVVQERKRLLSDMSAKLFTRRKQLISELLLIYPITLVEGSKRYSINEVQLPNAEDYGSDPGGQISVALGYTAHMVAMLSFFLGIPLRYSISHFGLRSRITDQITSLIPDKDREFPLYFKGREDVYSKYAVYLLNKNVSQLRWYCGLSTSELRATLPNLLNLLVSRLTIPGWPPSFGDNLEIAQELTEEVDQQLFRSDNSLSLDKGLDQIDQHQKEMDVWIRSSFSDFEFAAGHVVPSGEVRHSRAQDKFLSGWRKKTYESEEIDSRLLINSLNLDYDAGRRLSTSNSSLPMFNRLTPMIFLNDDGFLQGRSRRFGRVERQQNNNMSLEVPDFTNLTASSLSTPNENMSQVENHIKQLERRRSFCNDVDRHKLYERRRHSSFAEAPSKESFESEVTKSEAKAEDFVRRMSLVEMELNRKTPDIREEVEKKPVDDGDGHVSDDNDSDLEGETSCLVVEDDKEQSTIELSDRELLYSKPESPVHLSTKYAHSSGDERGDTPSPSFLRKPSKQQDIKAQESATNEALKKITENILNLSSTVPVPLQSSSYSNGEVIPSVNESESLSGTINVVVDKKVPSSLNTAIEDSVVNPASSICDTTNNDDDNNDSAKFPTFDNEEDLDDSSLWFRTQALVTSTTSFNMVKRRVSES